MYQKILLSVQRVFFNELYNFIIYPDSSHFSVFITYSRSNLLDVIRAGSGSSLRTVTSRLPCTGTIPYKNVIDSPVREKLVYSLAALLHYDMFFMINVILSKLNDIYATIKRSPLNKSHYLLLSNWNHTNHKTC